MTLRALDLLAHAARRAAVAAALALAAGSAHAQASDAELCMTISRNPDLAIQHCTRAIDAKSVSGERLAQLHYSRGIEWAAKGVQDRAIADYDAAIRLNPKYSDAYFNRGHAWGVKGEPDRAIADYDEVLRMTPKDPAAHAARAAELIAKGDYTRAVASYDNALTLNPAYAGALMGRARTRFYGGDFERSAADFARAFQSSPNLYTALWVYLARKRANTLDAEDLLDSDTRGHRDGGWPTPIIILYIGRTDAASVMAGATNPDSKRQAEQRCEAHLYLAEWHLLRGESDRAVPLLKEAQAGCPRDFFEYEAAVAELRRLAKYADRAQRRFYFILRTVSSVGHDRESQACK